MTTQEQIEFIRSKCIESNASILDLVFGCEITYMGKIYKVTDERFGCTWLFSPINAEIICPATKEIHNIIGREIRLADVLLAIRKQADIDFNIHIGRGNAYFLSGKMEHMWNLLKDSLSSQSPETIDFIFNLLNK